MKITSVPRWYTYAMREKLRMNCHKRADIMPPQGWMMKLMEEVFELSAAIRSGDEDRIIEEAADVGNMAMLTARFYANFRREGT